MRYSIQRETIYGVLCATKTHPDAEWVYNRVRETIPDVSLGTVYRDLGALVRCGKVVALRTADGLTHYDADVTPHAHFVCKNCHRITDFALPAIELPQGFAAENETHVYYGLCADCGKART